MSYCQDSKSPSWFVSQGPKNYRYISKCMVIVDHKFTRVNTNTHVKTF